MMMACMQFRKIEVHQSSNGFSWIQWLGIDCKLTSVGQLIAIFEVVLSQLELSRFSLFEHHS